MKEFLVNIRYWIYVNSYFLQYLILLAIFHYSTVWVMDYVDVAHFQRYNPDYNPFTIIILPMLGILITTLVLWCGIIRRFSRDTCNYDNEGSNGVLMILADIAYLIFVGNTFDRYELAFIAIDAIILAIIVQIGYCTTKLSD